MFDSRVTTFSQEAPISVRAPRKQPVLRIKVVACHSLKERENCLSLMYVGASGKGKSVCVNVFMPDRLTTRRFLHRVDSFTPASFVSHAANKKRTDLNQIDLLPKIKDKTMLTKEVSPLFRADFKEMQKNFAVLTSVLDGRGYVTESGAQGERGSSTEHLFNWIGATTPFSDLVYKLMAQLGNRIYFYEIVSVDLKEEDLVAFAKMTNGDTGLKECQTTVNDFIESHFRRYPLKSIDPATISLDDDVVRELVRYAQLISAGGVLR